SADFLVTDSSKMRGVVDHVKRLTQSQREIDVLLYGENGTGKELAASYIHEAGPRAKKPMIRVNCGAIPKDLVESHLFGADQGAVTSAVTRKGYFEAADGGIILPDEVGELPLAAQPALLRVLENRTIMRVGGTREIKVNVRVIAATNRDLEA